MPARSAGLDLKEESQIRQRPACPACPAVAAWRASSYSERRDLTTEVCYRPGAGGPLGRRSGFWYGRCLSW